MKNLLFRIRQYIFYCLKAKDEFSIHSPFLFAFYTNIIKRKKAKKSLQKNELISKIINSYPEFNVFTSDFTTMVSLNNRSNNNTISAINITDFSKTYPAKTICDFIEKPYTIIILFGIHKTKVNHIFWQNICTKDFKCVKLDFFNYGILINNPHIFSKQVLVLKK